MSAIRPGMQVRHKDATTDGVVTSIEDGIAVVRFAGPDGWPFPTATRVPVARLIPAPPSPEPEFIPAPF